jgi:hypothetical protein
MTKFSKDERREITFKILKNRRHLWIGHIVRHNEFVVNIIEGAISGRKAVGRPRLNYLKQVTRNTEADSYKAIKRMACNKSRWKAANQLKGRRIIIIIRRRRGGGAGRRRRGGGRRGRRRGVGRKRRRGGGGTRRRGGGGRRGRRRGVAGGEEEEQEEDDDDDDDDDNKHFFDVSSTLQHRPYCTLYPCFLCPCDILSGNY